MRRYARRDEPEEPVSIAEVECIRETEKAILCVVAGEEVWVPQSVVHEDSNVWRKGDTGVLIVAAWFARKNGLL